MEPTSEFGMNHMHENDCLHVHTENGIYSEFGRRKHVKHFEHPLCSLTVSNNALQLCDNISSLFDLCLVYVSTNIQNIESFVGFPDMIGEKILAAVQNRKILQTFADHDCASVLRLFDEAYHSSLLDELSVKNLAVLDQHIKSFSAFCHITKLDVTGCTLGDNHDYLLHIGHLSM